MLLSWAALTAYLIFAKWGRWPRLQTDILLAQRRCLTFADPPGRVVLDMGAHRLAVLSVDKGYREARTFEFLAWNPTSGAVSMHAEEVLGDLDAACKRMKHWNGLQNPKLPPSFSSLSFLDSAPNRPPVLFLHGLRAGGEPERLVVLHADESPGGAVSLYATVFSPAGLAGELVALGSRSVSPSTRLQVEGLRIFAGKPDPADPSRFTLDYENSAGKGTIEVRLLPDDETQLKLGARAVAQGATP